MERHKQLVQIKDEYNIRKTVYDLDILTNKTQIVIHFRQIKQNNCLEQNTILQ